MAEGCITALQAAGYNNGEGTTTIRSSALTRPIPPSS